MKCDEADEIMRKPCDAAMAVSPTLHRPHCCSPCCQVRVLGAVACVGCMLLKLLLKMRASSVLLLLRLFPDQQPLPSVQPAEHATSKSAAAAVLPSSLSHCSHTTPELDASQMSKA